MPVKKQKFTILRDDLTKAIDVDDSAGRDVPENMNFTDEGFLTKDTGYIPFGPIPDEKRHSMFHYEKKNGASYFLGVKGTVLQEYSFADRAWNDVIDSPTLTEDAEVGYVVYDDELLFGNGVESLYKWDGSTFTEYASAPKGNVLEVFEDRLFITGVSTEPLTVYYSNVGVPTTFTASDVLKPLGTDHVNTLINYYGTLLIFKQESIWKLTFVYDNVLDLFVPKLEVQSGNYGACSKKAATWVENDIWFFTGTEVRSIGYKDQQIGILGINNAVISDPLKETLKQINHENYDKVTVFYSNRRFYLCVPLESDENDTTFVSHLLYGSAWTKYTGRDKAKFGGSAVVNGIIYTYNDSTPFGVIKWTVEEEDKSDQEAYLITES